MTDDPSTEFEEKEATSTNTPRTAGGPGGRDQKLVLKSRKKP